MRANSLAAVLVIMFCSYWVIVAVRKNSRARLAQPVATHEVIRLPAHDFGVVDSLGTYVREFTLNNATDAVWTLKEAKAECGCTKVVGCSKVIAPGEVLRFTVELSPKGERFGPVSEDCYVILSPGPVVVSATVDALIVAGPRLVPTQLAVQAPPGQSAFRGECRLIVPSTWDDVELGFRHAVADLEVKASAPSTPRLGEREFLLEIAGTLPVQLRELRGVIEVRVTSPGDQEVLSLGLVASRSPSFRQSPRALFVLTADGALLSTAELYISEFAGAIEDLQVAWTPSDALTCSVDGTLGRIRIDSMSGPRAVLSITSDDGYSASLPVIRIERPVRE